MFFNSLDFVGFFIVVLAIYWLLGKRYKLQNLVLLVASYYFYGCWNSKFLILLAFSTCLDYYVGLKIQRSESERGRKYWLVLSIVLSLVVLGFFKYYNFFIESFSQVVASTGLKLNPWTLQIILPVGISFYTFHGMSYVIDIYYRRFVPVKSLVDYCLFVSFFPLLVAGPIERATHLLPQIVKPRTLSTSKINSGIFLILWGFFKKVVIADNLAEVSTPLFNSYYGYHSGLDLWLGVLAFAFQIYCDFSGYSDIARGLAKLMGFELLLNFRMPYISKNPSEFWQRWHISLSSWLRDYLYIGLGGNRDGELKTYRNIMITMLLGGLWHGAAWNFVLWGLYHGVLIVFYRLLEKIKSGFVVNVLNNRFLSVFLMFGFTLFGWLLFRGDSIIQIVYIAKSAFHLYVSEHTMSFFVKVSVCILPLLLMELYMYIKRDLLAASNLPVVLRSILYVVLFIGILTFGFRGDSEFIYFQF